MLKVQAKRNKIVLVLGKTGSGKSTLVKRGIPLLKRCIIFDPMKEYESGVIVESFDALLSYLKCAWDKKRFCIVCRFESLEEYSRAIYLSMHIGKLWLVIEELNWFIDCWSRDESFLDIVRFGRHHEISIIAVAQRAAEIPKLYTSQARAIVSFRQTEKNDILYLSKCGLIGEDGASRISKLPLLKDFKDFDSKYYLIFCD